MLFPNGVAEHLVLSRRISNGASLIVKMTEISGAAWLPQIRRTTRRQFRNESELGRLA